jgi:tetratricopeptide (TPR) repeat protein
MAKKIKAMETILQPENMNPQTPSDYTARGWVFYSQKKYDQAVADYKTALENEPENPDIFYALGLALKASGANAEALEAFSKVDQYLANIEDRQKATIVSRLAHGQVNQIKTGDWNLEKEVWQKSR